MADGESDEPDRQKWSPPERIREAAPEGRNKQLHERITGREQADVQRHLRARSVGEPQALDVGGTTGRMIPTPDIASAIEIESAKSLRVVPGVLTAPSAGAFKR